MIYVNESGIRGFVKPLGVCGAYQRDADERKVKWL